MKGLNAGFVRQSLQGKVLLDSPVDQTDHAIDAVVVSLVGHAPFLPRELSPVQQKQPTFLAEFAAPWAPPSGRI